MRNKLITLSGLDSAGKSTQIEKLESYFLSNNIKVKVIWSRGGYTPLFNVLKYILRKITPNKLPEPGESKDRDEIFSKKWIRVLWLDIAIVDLMIFYGLYFRLLNLWGYTIIADRFLHDTYVDWRLGFKNENFEKTILWKMLVYLSPKPRLSFLLTISVEEAVRRSKLKNEPFSENLSRREERRDLYLELIDKGRWKYIIDGLDAPDEVMASIKSKLK
jgi:thymidylate kinase